MKIIKKIIFFIIIISIFISGCSDINGDPTEKYDGIELRIGVIGSAPEVRETQILFEEIEFNLLEVNNLDSKYDAIFITKENLSEASNPEYVQIYKDSKIPFYFIGNNKSHVPFTNKELSYEEVPVFDDGMYVTALIHPDFDSLNIINEIGFYNDVESETNIKALYSRLFSNILEIKYNR
ncbi:hypothetical protein BHF68_00925 [Desulfuribacillus alkaliarsenatis]|uniref:Lipoprotein n=1 Tax=Desulfuribacillus alkaliarsenatis TaxID=766136 RepID=A0A1E5G6F9_9FIRM|nr:hypothetical protein BHF68_00925 [Desulfuribacillus alkaliarsenatis]